jgi:hypothetical protein
MMTNKVTVSMLLLMLSAMTVAQEYNVSPYSFFGIGDLQLSESGRTAGMASVSTGLSGRFFVNTSNPAALAVLDTSTFIFDITGSAKASSFTSGSVTQNTFSANFTRVTAGLHLTPRWSGALSLQPYSTVSYKVEGEYYIEGSETKATTLYEGSGGMTRLSLLNSFRLTDKFSFGADLMVLFGNIDRDASQSDITINENSSASTVTFTLGMLYKEMLSENLLFSAGVTYGHGSDLVFDNSLRVFDASGNTIYNDKVASSDITIPASWGAGFSLTGRKMIVAADYHYQKWSMTHYSNAGMSFTDTHKFNCGIAFTPAVTAPKSYFELIEYQAGFSLSNSYLVLNDINPINMEFTVGAGLPFRGGGQINIGLAWGKRGTVKEGLIREDYLRLSFSLSLVERMFLKRMYD